ncbi:MAG: gephyrin-like molybdotransferase Glp [Pseudomonadota bacterium]
MITVSQALDGVFSLLSPLDVEDVPLRVAAGRVLARPVAATRDQPPFATSVMDGYAVRAEDVQPGARFSVVGEAAAGHATHRSVKANEAIRIFTGAPVPAGASRVIIQEDVARDGDTITLNDNLDPQAYIRPAGADFHAGTTLHAPQRITPELLTLAAAMNLPALPCARQPNVAIIATGDELVMPGENPGPDQIIASNALGLAAILEAEGACTRVLPIARDTLASLETALSLATDADLIVTIGGASVGDHDLVRNTSVNLDFFKVAMRPGKPLMAGRFGDTPMIGLPGNPVSSLVCGHIFLRPTIRVLQGLAAEPLKRLTAPLAAPLTPNGPREHYMRALLEDGMLTAAERQDSGLVTVLAAANALIVRPVGDVSRDTGDSVSYIPLNTTA